MIGDRTSPWCSTAHSTGAVSRDTGEGLKRIPAVAGDEIVADVPFVLKREKVPYLSQNTKGCGSVRAKKRAGSKGGDTNLPEVKRLTQR
jgi:hypothetical protein